MSLLDTAERYFNLFARRRSPFEAKEVPESVNAPLTMQRQIAIWVGLMVGVLMQPIFPILATISDEALWAALWSGRTLVAALIALIIFPSVYKNAFNPTEPLLAQIGTVLMAGIGWRSVVDGAASVATAATTTTP